MRTLDNGTLLATLVSALETSLSAYKLRDILTRERGLPVTAEQFNAIRLVGLLGEPGPDGRWPQLTLDRLRRIFALGQTVRSLDRRLIWLADRETFEVDVGDLRAAMVRLIPRLDRPAAHLRLMAGRGMSPLPRSTPDLGVAGTWPASLAARVGVPPRRRARGSRRLPQRATWGAILGSIELALFDAWSDGWYAMVRHGIPAFYAPAPNPLDGIRFEEQVVLYAVLDIYRHIHQ